MNFLEKIFQNLKKNYLSLVVDKISPISTEINKLIKDEKFIDKILKDGADKANEIANKKIKNMKKIIGFK